MGNEQRTRWVVAEVAKRGRYLGEDGKTLVTDLAMAKRFMNKYDAKYYGLITTKKTPPGILFQAMSEGVAERLAMSWFEKFREQLFGR